MNKVNGKVILLTLSLGLVSGCSSVYDKHVSWESVEPETFPVIHAVGYAPISLQKSEHETQRMLMAIKASKLAAYAELAEQVYGQQVSSKVSMADLLVQNNQLSSSVQGVIRGAKVVKSYAVGDTYTTEMTLDFKEVYDIYLSFKRDKKIKSVRYY
ncbi:LPP20 family lipoprotein [Thalassomonas actiniarum]|uniref:LPP20 family lipoprotein n=1 Tax=Thalassomonas actiniarum TaxID=485447 RepID=A0AAF0C4G4_9GAMM|nr:LPP20 family lipoprotein [Thalassomonas actiniarum]WDE00463.1 LPP20 family lipoprotein [Thalassomonas actiniarum]